MTGRGGRKIHVILIPLEREKNLNVVFGKRWRGFSPTLSGAGTLIGGKEWVKHWE